MPTMTPIQMTGMQQQQMSPLQSLGRTTPQQSTNSSSLADTALSGAGVPWGDLYNDLQTEYWNRLIRDPNSGNIANVRVRDRTLNPSDNPGYVQKGNNWVNPGDPEGQRIPVQYTYGDWKDIPVTEYLSNMDKYRFQDLGQLRKADEAYNFDSGQAVRDSSSKFAPLAEGPLVNYLRSLTVSDDSRNGDNAISNYLPFAKSDTAVTRKNKDSVYGPGLLNYLQKEGVDLTNSRPWTHVTSGNDYSSVKSKYLDDYLNKWVYTDNALDNEPSYKKFGPGAEHLRWFADDPSLTYLAGSGDLHTPAQPSAFGTVSNVLGQYASANGKTFNNMSDPTYQKWREYTENIRKGENAKEKAGLSSYLSLVGGAFIPGLGPMLGTALGLTGTSAAMLGSSILGGGLSALSGQNPFTGALTAGLGAGLSSAFQGMNGFAAADAAQLASQGIGAGQIAQILGQSGVGAGASGLYGTLASSGLTNPAWATGAAKLLSNGATSLASGSKFNPVNSLVSSAIGSQLPGSMQWATPYLASAVTGGKTTSPLNAIRGMGSNMMTAMR